MMLLIIMKLSELERLSIYDDSKYINCVAKMLTHQDILKTLFRTIDGN